MVISSLFKSALPSPPAASSRAGPAPLSAVVHDVGALAGSLLGPKPAADDGVRFDFSEAAVQASAVAADPAPSAGNPAAAATPGGAGEPAPGTMTPVAQPVSAQTLTAQTPAKAAALPAGGSGMATAEARPGGSPAARAAAEVPDPDAEALARAWAVKAQLREGAQSVVERIAALDSRPRPSDMPADKAEQRSSAARTLAGV
ncbi:hypothetical protein [Paracoccus sp. MKU1]|uniref:hypothetical protein n=1 Tax=Paracoccus sp. MKU1 TaxID=1745182 RepID=UPI0007190BAD|nr:hypothetical protein [Paracoccus sp. MKU1]KRW95545.1 hypothetical protein AQY21_14050 [Paracoccus sp. MKU1]